MLWLRKCRKSKVQRTQLYFTVLSVTFIVTLLLIIYVHSITKGATAQQSSLRYALLARDQRNLKTVEKEEAAETDNETVGPHPTEKLKDSKKNDVSFPETSSLYLLEETLVDNATLQKSNPRYDGRDVSLSLHLKHRRIKALLTQGLNKDRQNIRTASSKHDDNRNKDTHDTWKNNNDDNNRSQSVINEDWVVALRSRTTRTGILRKRNLHWTIALAGKYSGHLFTPPAGEIPRQRMPHAIIIGVGHCGTRALLDFLTMHPYIVTSNNEIHFYDRDVNFAKGYSWYKAQMPLSYSNQITMEKTPCYIWSERALNEIYEFNRKTKLIVILKDPVARLVSMKLTYNAELIKANVPLTTRGVLSSIYDSRALIHGAYVKFLKPWFDKFPVSQIHILEGSDFTKDPATEINKLESFLQVPHFINEKNFYFNTTKGFFCMRPLHTSEGSCLGDNKGRQYPRLDPFVEKRLYEFYREHNEQLFQLLGRRYSWDAPEYIRNIKNVSRDTLV